MQDPFDGIPNADDQDNAPIAPRPMHQAPGAALPHLRRDCSPDRCGEPEPAACDCAAAMQEGVTTADPFAAGARALGDAARAAEAAADPLATVADHFAIRRAREILNIVNGGRERETFGTDDLFIAYAMTLGRMAATMQSLLDWIEARADRLTEPEARQAASLKAARQRFDWENSPSARALLSGIGRELGADPSWVPHVLRILKRDNPAIVRRAMSAAVQENADRLAADPAYNRG